MTTSTLCEEPEIIECRQRINQALGGLRTLHLGDLSENVAMISDDLLAAIDRLERLEKRHKEG